MTSSGSLGWLATLGHAFVGSPQAISRSPLTLDLFTVGEDGHLAQMSYGTSWVLTDLGTIFGGIHHTQVGVAWSGSNQLDVFATSQSDEWHKGWTGGSWASNYDGRNEYGAPWGTPAAVSWGPGRIDVFSIDPDRPPVSRVLRRSVARRYR